MTLSLRPATFEDIISLFSWRNDPETRRNSIDTSVIPWETHVKWVTSSFDNPNRKILIAFDDNKLVGTVRLDFIAPDVAELSWTIAPEMRGKGYGRLVLLEACKLETGKTLIARIKPENSASIKMVEHCGFERMETGANSVDTWRLQR